MFDRMYITNWKYTITGSARRIESILNTRFYNILMHVKYIRKNISNFFSKTGGNFFTVPYHTVP